MSFKNIIFDMSEVIIKGIHGVEDIVEKETNVSAKEYEARRIAMNEDFIELMKGMISEDEYIRRLIEGTGWNIEINTIKQIIRKNLGIPISGTRSVIELLKGKFNLILLSDYPSEWKEEILKKREELQLFDQKFFSCDFNMVKSDEGCFEYIVKVSNINPEETIFIDDYPGNVENAERIGITGIVFRDAEKLKESLVELQILDKSILGKEDKER